jgi:hypothetical protein
MVAAIQGSGVGVEPTFWSSNPYYYASEWYVARSKCGDVAMFLVSNKAVWDLDLALR